MTILHMDTDRLRSLVAQLKETHSAIEEQIRAAQQNVDSVVGGYWLAPAASSFQEEHRDWIIQMKGMLEGLDSLAYKLQREINVWEATCAVIIESPPPSDLKSTQLIRDWWHNILRDHGKYSSYAFFLILPSDMEVIRYLKDFGRELDLVSGNNCLVMTFGEGGIRHPDFEGDTWISAVDKHITTGYSIRIAESFSLDLSSFPCLVVFNDIRSSKHIIISLNDSTADEVAKKLRLTFSSINKAVGEKKNPLMFLDSKRKEEEFQKAGKSIVSKIRNFAGKTVEMVMESVISANIH